MKKTLTRNISLTPEFDRFAARTCRKAASHHRAPILPNCSDNAAQKQIDADMALPDKAIAKAPQDEEAAMPDILAAQKRARAKLRAT